MNLGEIIKNGITTFTHPTWSRGFLKVTFQGGGKFTLWGCSRTNSVTFRVHPVEYRHHTGFIPYRVETSQKNHYDEGTMTEQSD